MRWNGAFSFQFEGKSMETETTIWSEFLNGGKAIVEQILGKKEIKSEERKSEEIKSKSIKSEERSKEERRKSEEINKSKRAGPWEPQSGIRVGKLTIWLRLFEIEKL